MSAIRVISRLSAQRSYSATCRVLCGPSRAFATSHPTHIPTSPVKAQPVVDLSAVAGTSSNPPAKTKRTRTFRPSKAVISLTPNAVEHVRQLLDSPEPKYVKVGLKTKGCAGMAYKLDYVDKPERFDEVVQQDGVTVIVDSKALFSIIGSKMDWREDDLGAKFVFDNPNIKDSCGCGESFNF